MDYTFDRLRAAPRPSSLPRVLAGRLRSLGYCCSGVAFMFRTQASAWFHLAMTAAVVATSLALRLSPGDWRWVALAMVLVWTTEAVNTAVEHVCDVVSPGYNLAVKKAKDVAAAAVLLSAMGAATICILTWASSFAR